MLIFLIIFFPFVNKIFSSYIILPFKKGNTSNNFLQSKFNINIHTYMNIGEQKQKIKIYFRDEFFSFFILNKDVTYNEEELNETQEYNINIINSYDLYDNALSNSYKNFSENKNFFIDIYYRKGYLSSESFYFNISNENNLKKFDDIEFVLVNKIKPNRTVISGAIGLLVDEYFLEGAQNFGKMLVKKNVTKFCVWSKIYLNNENGIFIFGDYPHILYKDKFNKEQYIETDIKLNPYKQKWNINFDEIYFKNDLGNNNDNSKYFYLNTTLYGELMHNLGLIIGTVEYKNLIENIFFDDYIDNNICKKNKILINNFFDKKINYIYYSCNNESFDKSQFPNLFLKQNGLKYIFELNSNDLFALYNNEWYFLVIFEAEETANINHKWFFGEPLLKKYQFVFEPINYKIGFYNSLIPILNKEEKSKDNNIIKGMNYRQIGYYGIILLFLTIIILIIYNKLVRKNYFRKENNQSYTELQNLIVNKS